MGGVVDDRHVVGEGLGDSGGEADDDGEEAIAELAAEEIADIAMGGQGVVELVDDVAGLDGAALGVGEVAEETLDGLEADDGAHGGGDRNQNLETRGGETVEEPAASLGELDNDPVGAASELLQMVDALGLPGGAGGDGAEVVADERDPGASAVGGEGADGSGEQVWLVEIAGQRALGVGGGDEDDLAERGEDASEGRCEAGLAGARGEGEDGGDGEDRRLGSVDWVKSLPAGAETGEREGIRGRGRLAHAELRIRGGIAMVAHPEAKSALSVRMIWGAFLFGSCGAGWNVAVERWGGCRFAQG